MKSSLIVASVIVVVLMISFSFSKVYPAALTGNTNELLAVSNDSVLESEYSISTSIAVSASSTYHTDDCNSKGLWTDQMNIRLAQNDFPVTYSELQVVAIVNDSGYGCFDIEYWPNINNVNLYSYAFEIGYLSEFYSSGYGATFTVNMNGYWEVTSMYLSVSSDSWVIYPSDLCYSGNPSQCNPSIYLASDSQALEAFVMVGNTGGTSVTFTSGAGTISNYDILDDGTSSPQLTLESSNMTYTSLSCDSSTYTCTEDFGV